MEQKGFADQVQGFLEKGHVSPAPLAKGLSFVQTASPCKRGAAAAPCERVCFQVQDSLEKGHVSPAPLAKGLSFVQKASPCRRGGAAEELN